MCDDEPEFRHIQAGEFAYTSPPKKPVIVQPMKARLSLISTVLVLLGLSVSLPTVAEEGAVLQGLDKITARVSTFEAPRDTPIGFGTLEVVVRTCSKAPPEEPPESTAFLEIYNVPPGEEATRVFSGWMFSSSPALSAMEHPVYDIWVVDCIKAASSASSSTQ